MTDRGRMTDQDLLQSFERAFREGVVGCLRQCACGLTFFNPDEDAWTWEEGEIEQLEALQRDGKARALEYGVETLAFEGRHVVSDCECWKPRALKIAQFLVAHDEEIAAFLTEEKKRKTVEAQRAPVVEGA